MMNPMMFFYQMQGMLQTQLADGTPVPPLDDPSLAAFAQQQFPPPHFEEEYPPGVDPPFLSAAPGMAPPLPPGVPPPPFGMLPPPGMMSPSGMMPPSIPNAPPPLSGALTLVPTGDGVWGGEFEDYGPPGL
jgi:hypothetical protein